MQSNRRSILCNSSLLQGRHRFALSTRFYRYSIHEKNILTGADFKQPRMKSLLEKLWDILKQQGRP